MLTATAEIKPDTGRIKVDTPYRCKDAVKAVPGARWSKADGEWTVPCTWSACLALRAEYGDGLIIGPGLIEWGTEEAARRAVLDGLHDRVSGESVPEEMEIRPGWGELFPHQKVDAEAIARAGRYLVMHETGAGKTRSALGGLAVLNLVNGPENVFPLLIVAPKSMLITWQREAWEFFPDCAVNIAAGTPSKTRKALAPGADIYIIGWESLRRYSRLAPFGSLLLKDEDKVDKELQHLGLVTGIFDEVHRAKNCTSQRTRAAWAVADKLRFKIGLTGTPIQESPEDLYGILRLLVPDLFPTKTSYVERYLEVVWNEWGGREIGGIRPNREEEFRKVFHTVSRRMTKEMVLPWLPKKDFTVRWVELPPKHRKAYTEMQEKCVAELESTVMAADNAMVQAGRLIQLANSMGDLDAEGKFKMTGPSPKVDAFINDVMEGDYDGCKVVVFSDSRELVELLTAEMTKKKLSFTMITGDVVGDERQKAMDDFQDGKVDFCVLTRAGGEGITLTAANTMVRLMRSWSLTVHEQVEDRVHRIGSEVHDMVTYVDYITMDTLEEGQLMRLRAKKDTSEAVLKDGVLLDMLRASGAI